MRATALPMCHLRDSLMKQHATSFQQGRDNAIERKQI
jgi:hypothetical protein